jgi:hypothetical protein
VNKFNAKHLLCICLMGLHSANAVAAFEQSRVRYFAPMDFVHIFKQKFPYANSYNTIIGCTSLVPSVSHQMGADSPSSGKPVQLLPSTPFLTWYFKCVQSVTEAHFGTIATNSDMQSLSKFIPPSVRKEIGAMVMDFQKKEWADVAPDLRQELIRFVLESFIGPPSILKDLSSPQSTAEKISILEKYAIEKAESPSLYSHLRWVVIAVMLQSEFLRY